jgi:acyl-CoA synthetase (AMP-forming)/AMP-acid ligase II
MDMTATVRAKMFRERGWWGEDRIEDFFALRVAEAGDREAIVDPGNRLQLTGEAPRRLTWNNLASEVEAVAAVLLSRGVGQGDVIVAQLPNIVEGTIVFLAAARIGAIISPVPVQYRRHELEHIFALAKPKAYFCTQVFRDFNLAAMVREVAGAPDLVFVVGENAEPTGEALAPLSRTFDPETVETWRSERVFSADALFTLGWTSGTESMPKGVPRTHNQWLAIGRATVELTALKDGDILLNTFPMTNISSIGSGFMGWLMCGGVTVLHHPFDPALFLAQLRDEKPVWTALPPALLNRFALDGELMRSGVFATLRSIGSGSAPLPPTMIEAFRTQCGIEVVNVFGCNEGMGLAAWPEDIPDPTLRGTLFPRFGAAGISWKSPLAAYTFTKLVDPVTGEEILEPGVAGELAIAGPGVFDGYWGAPHLTAKAFDTDGYYLTGDRFEIAPEDPRCYRILGRYKDLIIRGGVNISPEEVDNIFAGHGEIIEAACIGIPDPILGERVCLCVVLPPGAVVTLEGLVLWASRQGVAAYKIPERLLVVESLPRNAMNKVVRRELREIAARLLAAQTVPA